MENLERLLDEWTDNPSKSPMCVFYRNKTVQMCCEGWSGPECSTHLNSGCENGTVFSDCAPACVQHCSGVPPPNGSEKCSEEKCKPGCTCPPESVSNGTHCVSVEQCPCIFGSKVFDAGSSFIEACQNWTCSNGTWVKSAYDGCCQACALFANSHIVTFDGGNHTFDTTCEYVLIMAKDLLSVTVENFSCVSCPKTLKVTVNGTTIEVLDGRNLTINGDIISAKDLHEFPGGLVARNFLTTTIQLDYADLQINVHRDNAIFITLSSTNMEEISGLCNANAVMTNASEPGQVNDSFSELATQWKIEPSCNDASTEREDACKLNGEKSLEVQKMCGVILGDTFAECRRFVANIDGYYAACIFNACGCKSGEGCSCSCHVITAFASICAILEHPVDWRNQEFCPVICKQGKTYSSCLNPCQRSCQQNLMESKLCMKATCSEGCFCPEGLYEDGEGTCVPLEECPCLSANISYPANTVIEKDCENCFCQNGVFQCKASLCPTPCSSSQYECIEDKACIPLHYLCNGEIDCTGGDDEKNCAVKIKPPKISRRNYARSQKKSTPLLTSASSLTACERSTESLQSRFNEEGIGCKLLKDVLVPVCSGRCVSMYNPILFIEYNLVKPRDCLCCGGDGPKIEVNISCIDEDRMPIASHAFGYWDVQNCHCAEC